MIGILQVVSMLQTATQVIGMFNGGAKLAKGNAAVQDALGVVSALTPLVQQFGAGEEITPADVRAALAGKDAALSSLDALIASKSAGA